MQKDSAHETQPVIVIVAQEIQALNTLSSRHAGRFQIVLIGQELSAFLMSSGKGDRSRRTRKWLLERFRGLAPGPILCTDIDLLFHPSLELDPLVLFCQISRQTKLIILWPGEYKDGTLSYAQPEHQHYCFWKNPEDIEIMGVNDALQ